eukprot:scaffold543_cov119-Cylindrotheca_fusiformis.AAC.4
MKSKKKLEVPMREVETIGMPPTTSYQTMNRRRSRTYSNGSSGGNNIHASFKDDPTGEAEDAILENLEAQSRRTKPLADGFRPAVPGERPPLNVERVGSSLEDPDHRLDDDDDDDDEDAHDIGSPLLQRETRPTFKEMAKRVQTINLLRKGTSFSGGAAQQHNRNHHQRHHSTGDSIISNITTATTSHDHNGGDGYANAAAVLGVGGGVSVTSTTYYSRGGGSSHGESSAGHRRAKTLLQSIDEKNENEEEEHTAGVMESHELVSDLNADLFSTDVGSPQKDGLAYLWNQDEEDREERLLERAEAVLAATSSDHLANENEPLLPGGTPATVKQQRDAATLVMERRKLAQQRRNEMRWRQIKNCFNPFRILQRLFRAIIDSTLVVSIPFFAVAWILFYHVGNPELDFLPGNATISWWFNFFGELFPLQEKKQAWSRRQLLVFDLARFTQYILIDILTMSSRAVVQMLGPWVTIFCLQSKGWPFLMGDNQFQTHWFYWTGIEIYSIGNSGSYILASGVYFRVLLGMIVAGFATTLKRTVLSLYFGKRTFDIYKPKLEKILNDIIVVTEIAELGAEADSLPEEESTHVDTTKLVQENIIRRGQLSEVRWSSLKFNDSTRDDLNDSTDDESSAAASAPAGAAAVTEAKNKKPGDAPSRGLMARTSGINSSGTFKIRNLLDRWEEPVNKLDKHSAASLTDILKFRKALTYMDLEYPFGEAFGPASTRNEVIKSAQILYHRLLKLAPGSYALPNSVLSVLSENEDGTTDMDIKKSVNNLFPADGEGEIPILAFIQNCDIVYRRLRYFRASVGNSSVIDKVLEAIIDGFFYFGLCVIILTLLRFNPWPLLVSMSTLLVTFAFAIGPTAAKAIEGILLIVGTRPFDIGDRIIIANTAGNPPTNPADSWFVEDISLFSTTIRFAGSNEVASVSNGSIATSRITNCARSKNAMIYLPLTMHISMHDGLNVEKFKDGLQHFVNDNPEAFDGLAFFALNTLNPNLESVIYDLCVRSRHSWQEAGRVLEDRGRLFQYSMELAKEMNVYYDAPATQQVLYYGGELKDGGVKDYKKNLLMERSNIIKRGDSPEGVAAAAGAEDNEFLQMLKQSHSSLKTE